MSYVFLEPPPTPWPFELTEIEASLNPHDAAEAVWSPRLISATAFAAIENRMLMVDGVAKGATKFPNQPPSPKLSWSLRSSGPSSEPLAIGRNLPWKT